MAAASAMDGKRVWAPQTSRIVGIERRTRFYSTYSYGAKFWSGGTVRATRSGKEGVASRVCQGQGSQGSQLRMRRSARGRSLRERLSFYQSSMSIPPLGCPFSFFLLGGAFVGLGNTEPGTSADVFGLEQRGAVGDGLGCLYPCFLAHPVSFPFRVSLQHPLVSSLVSPRALSRV